MLKTFYISACVTMTLASAMANAQAAKVACTQIFETVPTQSLVESSTADEVMSRLRKFPLSLNTEVKDVVYAGLVSEEYMGKSINGSKSYVEVIRKANGTLEMNIFSGTGKRYGDNSSTRVSLSPDKARGNTIFYKGVDNDHRNNDVYTVISGSGYLSRFIKAHNTFYGAREYVFEENLLASSH